MPTRSEGIASTLVDSRRASRRDRSDASTQAHTEDFHLLRYFLAVSIVANVVILVLAATLLPALARREIYAVTASAGAREAEMMKSEVFPEVGPQSTNLNLSAAVSRPEFGEYLQSALAMSAVRKVKIWDAQGNVLFSTDQGDVGTQSPSNQGFLAALAGRTYSKVEHETEAEYPGEESLTDVVEVYVPITSPETGEPIGAFEVYQPVDLELLQRVSAVVRIVIWGGMGLLAVQFATLLAVVYRGHRVLVQSRRSAEEAQHRAMQVEKSAVIGQLAGRVAHELLNPLAALMNALLLTRQRLQEHHLTDVVRLGIIEREASRINRLVRDLLAYSEPPRLHWEHVDLNRVVEETLEGLVVPPNIDLAHDVKPVASVVGDPQYLCQALSNLIANAIEAMPQGGVLSLNTYETDGGAAIDVGDTGPGIAEGERTKIFDALYTTKVSGGFGLGLPAARSIVKAHGGEITLSSQVGKGTTFRLWLPAHSPGAL